MKNDVNLLGRLLSALVFLALPIAAYPQTTVTTTGGTAGVIPKFTTSSNIQNSDITDSNGVVSISNLNHIVYVDGVTNKTIAAAINALPAGGGTVIVPPGSYAITQTLLVGTSTKRVVLQLYSASIDCNITNGTDCISIGAGSIVACMTPGAVCNLALDSTANVRSIVTNADHSGAQEWFSLTGVNITTPGSGIAVSSALLDIEGVGANSVVRDVNVSACPGRCVQIVNPSTSVANTDMVFDNVWINGFALTTSTVPLYIDASSAGGFAASITFIGGAIEHAGGTNPLVDAEGIAFSGGALGTTTSIKNLSFHGTAFEISSGSPVVGVKLVNTKAEFYSDRFAGSSGSYTDAIQLSGTAGGISAFHVELDQINATNTINDEVNGVATGQYQSIPLFTTANAADGKTMLQSPTVIGNVSITGNLSVSGTVSKGGGSFKIDHPLDPANKYLYHSFVESPDMMDVYNGNVVTNSRGYALILLPDYFEALNRDFRYQLTTVGGFSQVTVIREIKNNRFTIKTSKPNAKVSWQVTGIRHDAYANEHRIPVEENKPQ